MASENHVENPFEYVLERGVGNIAAASKVLIPHPERHAGQAVPEVRRITMTDVQDALRLGAQDLGALRDDILFIGVIYPVAGLVLAALAANVALLPMVFPLASGFAILGPVAAVGLYEMSRRREQGENVTWADSFGVLGSPALGSIIALGAVLLALFGMWLASAYELNLALMGPKAPPTILAFSQNLFWTQAGGILIVTGFAVGFLFSMLAFAVSVVSFPLLIDRDVGVGVAIKTSVEACFKNPGVMFLWGMIVAGMLALGSLPALVGLIVVVPLLGHASWHLYRRIVV
jgi:uncharacterized membrane protein